MRHGVILICCSLCGIVAPARSQAVSVAPFWVEFDGLLARPVGEFRRHVAGAAGVNVALAVRPGPRRALGVRVELSEWSYGKEARPVPYCLLCGVFLVESVTRHKILALGVGPELTVPIGAFRLALTPQIGISRFRTTTAMEGLGVEDNTSQTNLSTTAFWYGGGIDLSLPFGAKPASLQVGVRFFRNGRVRYLTPAGITENADGSLALSPTVGTADVMQLRFGLAVGATKKKK